MTVTRRSGSNSATLAISQFLETVRRDAQASDIAIYDIESNKSGLPDAVLSIAHKFILMNVGRPMSEAEAPLIKLRREIVEVFKKDANRKWKEDAEEQSNRVIEFCKFAYSIDHEILLDRH